MIIDWMLVWALFLPPARRRAAIDKEAAFAQIAIVQNKMCETKIKLDNIYINGFRYIGRLYVSKYLEDP